MNAVVDRATGIVQTVELWLWHDPRRTQVSVGISARAGRVLVVLAAGVFVATLPLTHYLIGGDAIHLAIIPIAAAAILEGGRAGLIVTAIALAAEGVLVGMGLTPSDVRFGDILMAALTGSALSIALGRVHFLLRTVRDEAAARADAERSRADAEKARADALEDLAHRASFDALTGLPNRLQLEREIDEQLRRSLPEGMELVAVALNLAEFHEFNDTFGYGAGDLLLRQVPQRLRRVVEDCVVGRIAGDEFCIATCAPAGTASALGRRALDALALPFAIDGIRVAVTGSTGVAVARPGESAAELLRRVTIALSAARTAGRTSVAYSDVLARSSPERLALVADLQEAIEADRIGVVFQPQVDPATGAFVGAEALARWTHPTRGAIAPDEFVQLAERTGLIGGLTDRILAAAVREWGSGQDGARVAVNVSMLDLSDATLPARITTLLASHGLQCDRFTVEVTESVLARDMRTVIPVLGAFREARIHVSVDDFGTGYSSLAYLNELPIDEVKLDRSFVGRAAEDPRACAILRSAVGLARELGLRTVAEGVEDARTYDLLAATGCSAVQGYVVSKPLSGAEMREWLASR
ncbi:MAG: bifunctional diguanylate cyclase/phosphodiesterase [Chloroflexota bacterium]|nr:bifunctional diguanylate cyclase/phosphodiesterase [Chloroflexota bacterium]